MATRGICSIAFCGKPHKARGLCDKHYKKDRRMRIVSGDAYPRSTTAGVIRAALESDTDECLFWPFARTWNGYGVAHWQGKVTAANRVVCELAHGAPPTNGVYYAAHSCGKGHLGCYNPKHLRWATPSDNGFDTMWHRAEERLHLSIHGEPHPRVDKERIVLAPADRVLAERYADPRMSPEEASLTLEHLRVRLSPTIGTKP
jgi:hypothetical protein